MRPYLAIIKDSFRAAMASRVLYVLLFLITILLIAIAPLHMQETLDWELKNQVNVNADRLLRRIAERHDDDREQPIARIWEMLPEKTRKKMTEIVQRDEDEAVEDSDAPGVPPKVIEDIHTKEELIEELNNIIKDPAFYRPEDWEGRMLPREAEELVELDVDNLSEERSKRLNRLLIANAVSPTIETGNSTALDFYYAIWRIPIFSSNMTHQQFAQSLTSQLPVYFDKFVMSIGLLIAILVTANMIPETFESGSLNLLLSKPISRWGLYTAKFVGGCVFIALCAGYLFLGIWIWLGLAMEVWDRAMLASIPLYIIVFAIYFSVSALIGLWWRSAIVSVILTLLFWAFCFTIGSAYGFFNTKMENNEFIGLLPVKNKICAIDLMHQFKSWDEKDNQWKDDLEAEMGQQGALAIGINSYFVPLREIPAAGGPGLEVYIAPVFDSVSSRIIAGRYEFGQFLSSGKKKMFVADADNLSFKEVGRFPRDTIQLFETDSGVLAATADGAFYRLDDEAMEDSFAEAEKDAVTEDAKSEDSDSSAAEGEEADGTDSAVTDTDETEKKKEFPDLFFPIGPDQSVSIRSAGEVAYSHARNEFVVYRRGTITIFRASGEDYRKYASLDLNLAFDKGMTSRVAYQGDMIVIAFGNGKIITIDGAELKELSEYQPETRSGIDQLRGSRNGRYFAALYRNGNLWMLDTQDSQQIRKANVPHQGRIATFAFGENDQLWVSHNTDRVTLYDLSSGAAEVNHVPAGGWLEKSFRYGLRPFYRICPKPGEFYKVVTHLSSAGDTESNEDVDLNKSLESSDPWSPLWSGLGFMVLMLALGCLVFQYKDY